MTTAELPLKELYEADEVAWLDATVEQIRLGNIADIDFPNLEEYLTSMANRDRREVVSRMVVLLTHILKWMYQPEKRTRSWILTIRNQRNEILKDFTSGVLYNHAVAELAQAYLDAVEYASIETGLSETAFPTDLDMLLAFEADPADLPE